MKVVQQDTHIECSCILTSNHCNRIHHNKQENKQNTTHTHSLPPFLPILLIIMTEDMSRLLFNTLGNHNHHYTNYKGGKKERERENSTQIRICSSLQISSICTTTTNKEREREGLIIKDKRTPPDMK